MNEQSREILEKIKREAYDGWPGTIGETRGKDIEQLITTRFSEYAEKLGYSFDEILKKAEENRTYSAVNYYQPANFPSLDNVRVFDTLASIREAIPRALFRCPACGGISKNPYECDTGFPLKGSNTGVCDWKAYGFFRTTGKGLMFTIKEIFLDHPIMFDEMFMPIDLETQDGASAPQQQEGVTP